MKKLRIRIPRLSMPKLLKDSHLVFGGLYTGIHNGITNRSNLRSNATKTLTNAITGNNIINAIVLSEGNEQDKPVIGAGKGGKVYGLKTTKDFDGVIETTRQKKKKVVPYKPIPQMHELISLEEIQRKCGIRKSRY